MKFIIILSILTSLLFADEMARIESIVKDIAQLRQKYEACQDKLDKIESGPAQCAVNELELKQRHQEILALQKKNESLKKEHASQLLHIKATLTKTIASNEKKIAQLDSKNRELNEEIKALHVSLDAREKKVKALSKQSSELQLKSADVSKLEEREKALEKEREALKQEHASELLHVKSNLRQTIADHESKIALLESKNRELNKKIKALSQKDTDQRSKADTYATLEHENAALKREIVKLKAARLHPPTQALPCQPETTFPKLTMKPEFAHVPATKKSISLTSKTYRLKHESKIYDAINGKVVDTWEDQRSFTSNNQKEQWIQITGYFVNRLWKPARDESLWVKKEDAFERPKK